MSDLFWHRATLGCPPDLTPWLRDRGSLTLRIQQRCTHFAVHPLRCSLAGVAYDESSLLGLPLHQAAYSREVFLHADEMPVVFAHSACDPRHLRSPWQALLGLGNQPLGKLLFSHPQIERRPLHFKPLRATHPLYRRATLALTERPACLWARRSLFLLQGAPLLVTEVFLPGITRLPAR